MSRASSDGAALPMTSAQCADLGTACWRPAGLVFLLAWGSCAIAQDAAQGRAITLSPSVSISETLTDNARLSAADKTNEAVTQLTAALRMSGRSGRVQGLFDYALSGYVYAHDSASNTVQNTLNARLKADLIENWLSITGNAAIGQQAVSAFGVQSFDPILGRANRTEVRSYQISPIVQGKTVGDLDYQASATRGATRTDSNATQGNTTSTSGAVSVGSSRGSNLSWSALLSRQQVDYDGTRSNLTDTAKVSLAYVPAPNWQLSANAGRESSNVVSINPSANAIWGFGANWSPASNLRVNGQFDHRFFGTGYQLGFEYRLPRSLLRLSSSRDVSTAQPTIATVSTIYDFYSAQIASQVPDLTDRDRIVRDQLQKIGRGPTDIIPTSFLPGVATLQQRTDFSYALQGVRSTLAFSMATTTSRPLDRSTVGTGDFSRSSLVRQRFLTVSLGHRLTPVSGISFELARQTTDGSLADQFTVLNSARLSLTTSLGQRSTASLAARHVVSDGSIQPYTENAIIATFGLKF